MLRNRWVIDAPSLGHASKTALQRRDQGAEMLAWLLWQLEKIERIRAAAGALMMSSAMRPIRRRVAGNVKPIATRWRVTGGGSPWSSPAGRQGDSGQTSHLGLLPEPNPPTDIVSEPSRTFRIEFVCGTVDRGPTNLTEKQIKVADAPSAIIAAANIKWPPQTIGVRILDREGHEVFVRQKARRA